MLALTKLYDGMVSSERYRDKGSRTTIGIETVNICYARKKVAAEQNWIICTTPNCKQKMLVQPWSEDQLEMMAFVGKEILSVWPHISPRNHHGLVEDGMWATFVCWAMHDI